MKRSAGILPYKIENNKLYVYLERPGGPFWRDKNIWSICKGEYNKEKAIDAAVREFYEESGFTVNKDELIYLGGFKFDSTNKLVNVFIVNCPGIDPSQMKSNTFKREWPKGSGVIVEFNEMDEGRWFLVDEAYSIIFQGQERILHKLKERV